MISASAPPRGVKLVDPARCMQFGKDDACPICLSQIQYLETRPCAFVGCEHVFCEPCIRRWLDVATTCPMCRRDPGDPA